MSDHEFEPFCWSCLVGSGLIFGFLGNVEALIYAISFAVCISIIRGDM